MTRKRRKIGRPAPAADNGNENEVELRAIKMTLKQSLRPAFREAFIALMEKWCKTATYISFLASMLVLYKVNRAMDTNDDAFWTQRGEDFVRNCFLDVLNGYNFRLPVVFRSMFDRRNPNFIWPNREGMGNAFNSLYEQYIVNVKNNLKVHYVRRIRSFLRMRCFEFNHGQLRTRKPANIGIFDEVDIKNATKFLINQRDWTRGDANRMDKMQFLLNEVERVGGPSDFNLKQFVTTQWFASLQMWIKIQRYVTHFQTTYSYLNSRWARYHQDPLSNMEPIVPRPPKIHNFNAIPIHNYHLKHIRIDTALFYAIACKLGALKLMVGKSGRKVNISRDWYNQNPSYYWQNVFDMKKIKRIGGNNKTFDCTIMTDSVSVSLIYVKANRALDEIDLAKIRRMYQNFEFVYELGVDPGVRTWNATVRRRIDTGSEVCAFEMNTFYCMCIQ